MQHVVHLGLKYGIDLSDSNGSWSTLYPLYMLGVCNQSVRNLTANKTNYECMTTDAQIELKKILVRYSSIPRLPRVKLTPANQYRKWLLPRRSAGHIVSKYI
jgi:hypothetical protein